MRTIPLSSLIVEETRQRKLFAEKPLDDLAHSIASKGLMHPPVARANTDGTYTLIAGERRSRAIRSLIEDGVTYQCDGEDVPAGHIPLILLSDLSAHGYKEAELEENTVRENLTWQETAMAIAELHKLRREQSEDAGQTNYSFKATATEIKNDGTPALGDTVTRVVESVIIASKLDDPDIMKAKSQKEAMKILRKKAETAHRAKLAETFDQTSTPHQLYHSDSLTMMKKMPAAYFDCILTDPPYGVDANNFGSQTGQVHGYEDTRDYALSCYQALATEGYRVTKSTAVLYAFCDIRSFNDIAFEFELAGWKVWPVPFIWAKTNGMLPRPEHGPRRTYEAIVYATKGNALYHKTGTGDVIIQPQREALAHGAQKPVALYAELLARSTLPGAIVLDPFCGSGTIFPAANAAKVIAYGIEISEEYYNLSLSRMAGESPDEDDILAGLGV